MKSSNGCGSICSTRCTTAGIVFELLDIVEMLFDGIRTVEDADEISGLMSLEFCITDATAVADAAAIPVAVFIAGVVETVDCESEDGDDDVDVNEDGDDDDGDDVDDDDKTERGFIFFNFEQLNFKLQFAFFIFSSLFVSFGVQQVQVFDEFCVNAK